MTTVSNVDIDHSINGVDVSALNETIEAIKETPEMGQFTFRARNRWVDGPLNRSAIKGFCGSGIEDSSRKEAFVFENDGPPSLLGENRGANPVEFVLHGLAGCLTTTLVYHAALRGVTLTEVESTLEGNLDLQGFLGINDSVRNGYKNIQVNFTVKGDAPQETLDELFEIAKARSVVFDIITNKVPVEVRISPNNN